MTTDTPSQGQERPPRRRTGLLAGSGVIVAAVATMVAFLLPDEVDSRVVVVDVAGIHARAPTGGPPQARSPTLLGVDVEGVPFPALAGRFGWVAVGTREDVVRGRRILSVYYERGGARLGYTIIAGRPLAPVEGARRTRVAGTRLRNIEADGRTVVVWVRRGHTCVLSGAGAPAPDLNRLAAWKGRGAVPF